MAVRHSTLEASAAHLAESNAGTVVGVDVGRNLEDETGELGLFGADHALLGLNGTRRGGYLDKTVEQFLHTEIVECRTEKDGGHIGRKIGVDIKGRVNAFNEFQVIAQLLGVLVTHMGLKVGGMDINLNRFGHLLFVGCEEIEPLFIEVVHAFELGALVDGPREGAHADLQFLLQLIEKIEGVATLTVHFVDKNDDWRLAHTAHGHQFPCLRFHALGPVNHNDNGIYSGQRTECVLGKILVTGGVEDVDLIGFVAFIGRVVELHDGGGYGDAALLLYLHPVAGGSLADLVVLYGSGHLNLATEKQKFFSKRGFTGVRMGNDGKGAPTFYLGIHFCKISMHSRRLSYQWGMWI